MLSATVLPIVTSVVTNELFEGLRKENDDLLGTELTRVSDVISRDKSWEMTLRNNTMISSKVKFQM